METADRRLSELGCVHDPSARGYDRWTHTATGKAVVRQPYLYLDAAWEGRKNDFADAIESGQLGNWSA